MKLVIVKLCHVNGVAVPMLFCVCVIDVLAYL